MSSVDRPDAAAPTHVYEPSIDEILSDPIVHLVLRRDGLTAAGVRAGMERERRRLAARRKGASASGDADEGVWSCAA